MDGKKVAEVPLEQQLEELKRELEKSEKRLALALRLLSNEPQDRELWHTNLDLIDAKLKIADLEKRLKEKRKWS